MTFLLIFFFFFFSSRRRHTRCLSDWSSDVCSSDLAALAILGGVLLIVLGALGLRGLIAVGPGQARVVQLFGRYTGTVRTSGLQWVNPFTTRRTVSTRIRNHETPVLKVNDADGTPIAIAA